MQHGDAEHISGSDLHAQVHAHYRHAQSSAISDLALTNTLAAPDRDAH